MLEALKAVETRVLKLSQKRLGYSDFFDPRPYPVRVIEQGDGLLVHADTITPESQGFEELHVFSHGGHHLPEELTWAMRPVDVESWADALDKNRDSSTSALAMSMVSRLSAPGAPRRLIAFFNTARTVIDANRTVLDDQIPEMPYRGQGALRFDLTREQKETIAEEFLHPWFNLVEDAISTYEIPVVFHHHSYDTFGTGDASHERCPGDKRPAGMVCREVPESLREAGRRELLSRELLDEVTDDLGEHFREIEADASVRVDWPYEAPEMPFLPRFPRGERREYESVIYEARKDLLHGQRGLTALVHAAEDMSSSVRRHLSHAA